MVQRRDVGTVGQFIGKLLNGFYSLNHCKKYKDVARVECETHRRANARRYSRYDARSKTKASKFGSTSLTVILNFKGVVKVCRCGVTALRRLYQDSR